jgi:hypothetical protein
MRIAVNICYKVRKYSYIQSVIILARSPGSDLRPLQMVPVTSELPEVMTFVCEVVWLDASVIKEDPLA